jgi:hypothetical protein
MELGGRILKLTQCPWSEIALSDYARYNNVEDMMSIYNENEPTPPEEFPLAESPPKAFVSDNFPPESPPLIIETAALPTEKPIQPDEGLMKSADRSTMSQSTMIFGLAALSLSILGGTFIMLDVFQHGLTDNLLTALVKVIPVTLAYIVGWSLCLLSMRSFGNLVLPILIKYYLWITLAGLVIVYLKIMQKLFEQTYDLFHFFSYNVVLAAWLTGLIGLHLLLDQQSLRRYSIPIIMASTWHLVLMVIRFVVIEQNNPVYLFGDLYFFIIMFGLAVLMLAHLGILDPLRGVVNALFQPAEIKEIVT